MVVALVTVVRFFVMVERFVAGVRTVVATDGAEAGRDTPATDDFVCAVVVGRSTVAVGIRSAPAVPRPDRTSTATDANASKRQRPAAVTMSRMTRASPTPFRHASTIVCTHIKITNYRWTQTTPPETGGVVEHQSGAVPIRTSCADLN